MDVISTSGYNFFRIDRQFRGLGRLVMYIQNNKYFYFIIKELEQIWEQLKLSGVKAPLIHIFIIGSDFSFTSRFCQSDAIPVHEVLVYDLVYQ